MTSCTESSGCPRHALRSRMRVQIFSHLISFFSPHAILLEEGGCAMALLEKKEILYSVRGNRAEWKKLKKALKDARIRGVSSDVWLDEAPACGCGAHRMRRLPAAAVPTSISGTLVPTERLTGISTRCGFPSPRWRMRSRSSMPSVRTIPPTGGIRTGRACTEGRMQEESAAWRVLKALPSGAFSLSVCSFSHVPCQSSKRESCPSIQDFCLAGVTLSSGCR